MIDLLRQLTLLLAVAGACPAEASLIQYTFSVSTALVHGTETLGGPSDPLVFGFLVDSNGPNLSGSPTDGTYPIGDHGVGGNGSVTIGGVLSMLQGGAFHVSNATTQDVVEGTANLQANSALINGRTLFVSSAVVWDSTAQMLSNIDLPLTDSFQNHLTNGAFSLTFFAKAGDPEFLTGNYVTFSAFVGPENITVEVQMIPEPGTLALIFTALAAARLLSRSGQVNISRKCRLDE